MLSLPGARARFEFRPISIRTRKRFLRCWYIRACKSGFRGERSSAGREKAYKKDRSMDELSQYPYTFLHPLFHWWFEKMLPCSPVSKSRKGYIIHGYWIAYMRKDPTKERERERKDPNSMNTTVKSDYSRIVLSSIPLGFNAYLFATVRKPIGKPIIRGYFYSSDGNYDRAWTYTCDLSRYQLTEFRKWQLHRNNWNFESLSLSFSRPLFYPRPTKRRVNLDGGSSPRLSTNNW